MNFKLLKDKSVSIFFFITIFLSCNTKEPYPDRNFSFENKPWADLTWITGTKDGLFLNDTADYIHGKQSICFTNRWQNQKFDSYLFQYLNLPVEAKKVKFKIHSKSEILDNAWLKVLCIDRNENIISKDSVNIISSGKWTESDLLFNTANAKRMYIEIHAASKDTFLLHPSGRQKLWVDNLQMEINGKSLLNYSVPKEKIKNQEIAEIKNNIVINPETFKELERIEDFTSHRILAFGESVHGCDEIQKATFKAIKYLMAHEQCKLLLMEIPFEMGLRINDYLQGNTFEDIESLMMFYNYNLANIAELFNWIKRHNENAHDKIYLSGIDINLFSWMRDEHLTAYLKNQISQTDSIEKVIGLIEGRKYSRAMNAVQQLQVEENVQKCITHALKYRMNRLHPKVSLLEGNRDYIQFINARFAIETWLGETDKAVVYAHLGHVNKKHAYSSRFYIPNFGNYMQKEYNGNYFVTAVLVGKGTISNTDSLGVNPALPLIAPPTGSIEELCLRTGDILFYKNLSAMRSLNSVRNIGVNYVTNQFYPCSHTGRFDALLFIKNSNGYPYPESWPKTKKEILKYLKGRLR